MTQKDFLQPFMRRDREEKEHSRRFLEKIDQLEAEIAATSDDVLRSRLEHERAAVRRQFAVHLKGRPYVHDATLRTVRPLWLVTGVPSKRHREEAKKWMKARGVDWDGSAPPLHHELRKALAQKVPITNEFGLDVEWTIDIKAPHVFTVNESGGPRSVVIPEFLSNGANKQEDL
jgi:hypothetical protein